MIMRPDEIAGQSEIERDQRFRSNVARGVGTAATTAAGLGSAAAASKILPWLNQYIPAELAMKGLSKVSPKLADFLKRGQSAGLNVEEGIQYLREQLPNPEEKKSPEKAKENRNLIEQYSPELHQFIVTEMKNGRKAMEAGALATLKFKKEISKITKDHKTPWSAIIQSIYGTQEPQQTAPNQPEQQQKTQTQQGGAGQQALMAILEKINQRLGQ